MIILLIRKSTSIWTSKYCNNVWIKAISNYIDLYINKVSKVRILNIGRTYIETVYAHASEDIIRILEVIKKVVAIEMNG